MTLLGYVGVLALIVLVVVASLLILRQKMRRLSEPLPDGDYVVTEEGTRETPQGPVTVFKVVEPKGSAGRILTVIKSESGKEDANKPTS